MSADNYIAIDTYDDKWYVWMVLGGYHDDDWDVVINKGKAKEFNTFLGAYSYAQDWMGREIVEYGIHVLANVKEHTDEHRAKGVHYVRE